jgi:hypothetical protein
MCRPSFGCFTPMTALVTNEFVHLCNIHKWPNGDLNGSLSALIFHITEKSVAAELHEKLIMGRRTGLPLVVVAAPELTIPDHITSLLVDGSGRDLPKLVSFFHAAEHLCKAGVKTPPKCELVTA